jgi:hypothetical protein
MTAEPDTRALAWTPSRAEVAEFRRRESSSRRWNDLTGLAIGAIVVVAVLVGGVPLISTVLLAIDSGLDLGALLFPLVVFGAAALAVLLARQVGWASWSRRLKLYRFAEDNGLRYDEPADDVGYPGAAFHVGSSRSRDLCFRTVDGPTAEFGTYRWTVGSGKSRRTYSIGYAAVRLERPLPHLVLDARGNNGFFGVGIIPFAFDRDQVLSLEGDFDRYFTLYCPSHYERDALYVFTPDIMALLIDESSWLDVEIVDDWMFFYATRPFDVEDAATWRRLFRLHDVLVGRIRRTADRYRDDRVPGQDTEYAWPTAAAGGDPAAVTGTGGASAGAPPMQAAHPVPRRLVVAPDGRRLRRGTPWAAIVAVVVLGGGWILLQLIR